jgi:hypothetical protein
LKKLGGIRRTSLSSEVEEAVIPVDVEDGWVAV